MQLITAILARNEAGPDRYLRRVIGNAQQWSDFVILLDDNSDDDTARVAREAGAWVETRESLVPAWGCESPARKELWDLVAQHATDFDSWVLFQDADMLLSADPRPLLQTVYHNTWCWTLYDLWDRETTYRTDGYWRGHLTPRPWLVRPSVVPAGWTAEWSGRGLHCGHLPSNWPMSAALAPEEYYWLHLGWINPEHRLRKSTQYLEQTEHLTAHERAHAESILDD